MTEQKPLVWPDSILPELRKAVDVICEKHEELGGFALVYWPVFPDQCGTAVQRGAVPRDALPGLVGDAIRRAHFVRQPTHEEKISEVKKLLEDPEIRECILSQIDSLAGDDQ